MCKRIEKKHDDNAIQKHKGFVKMCSYGESHRGDYFVGAVAPDSPLVGGTFLDKILIMTAKLR